MLPLSHVQRNLSQNNNFHTYPKQKARRTISFTFTVNFFFQSALRNLFFGEIRLFLHLVIRSMSCRTEKTDSVLDEMLHYRNYNTESLEGIRSRLKPRIRGCLNSMQETFIQCQNTSR